MNRTHFEHLVYALLMMLAVWGITQDYKAGAAFGIAFFLGREHAQAQNKYKVGDFAAFNVFKWSKDAVLDLVFPTVGCILAAIAIWRFMK